MFFAVCVAVCCNVCVYVALNTCISVCCSARFSVCCSVCCSVLQCVGLCSSNPCGPQFFRKCAHMDTYIHICIYTYIHKFVGLCRSNSCGFECVAVCCSVLQCVWEYVAQIHMDSNVLHCVAVCVGLCS